MFYTLVSGKKHDSSSASNRDFAAAILNSDSDFAATTAHSFGTDTILFYVDHTVRCPSNTGMQRLTRQLARGLLNAGKIVRFVKWDDKLEALVLINRLEANHLAQWNGPQFTGADMLTYPPANEARLACEALPNGHATWLLVPEVTHINYHDKDTTLDVILSARKMRCKVAFIYYDAIPLRLEEYTDSANRHDVYMQALLLADVILPISARSASELIDYFTLRQLASRAPLVAPVLLPGETDLAPRIRTSIATPIYRNILCVGSVEPRKNQKALIEAFLEFVKVSGRDDWTLTLAGHLHHSLAEFIQNVTAQHPSVRYIPAPTDRELADLYRACDFTVFPSIEEGFGLPILESLWFGRPCICANFGAMAEVAAGGGCLTIDTHDKQKLLLAMERVACEEGLLASLSHEAVGRHLETWDDYAINVAAALEQSASPLSRIGKLYYWLGVTKDQNFTTGVQRVVRQLANALIESGVSLIPVVWDDTNTDMRAASPSELDQIASLGGPTQHRWATWAPPATNAAPAWLLVAEIDHLGMGRIYSAARKHGLKCAAVFYDAIPYKLRHIYNEEWQRNHAQYMLALSHYDKIFCISRTAANDLLEYLFSVPEPMPSIGSHVQILTLPNEVANVPRCKIPASIPERIRILCVGTVEPRKNHLTLMRAFAVAAEKSLRPLELTLIGRPSSQNQQYINDVTSIINSQPNCTWLQSVDDESLTQLYSQCTFSVYPSLEEGYGLPIVESLWYGKPCISHNAGAMGELAAAGGCLTVDMADELALSRAILALSEQESLYHSLAVAAIRRPAISWTAYAQTLIAILDCDELRNQRKQLPESDRICLKSEFHFVSKRPILSICVSTYNRAKWLALNLQHLYSDKDCGAEDVEILVVDNASSDNTSEIAAAYLDRPNFRYIRNLKNVGMLGNLRKTAHAANGEFIWILGDDDFISHGVISKLLHIIKNHNNLALIYPNYAYTTENNPDTITSVTEFLSFCPPITPATPDEYCRVKTLATKNENLFTAIYALILRRDHALQAYSQVTHGRPFSTMRTAIPTTYYILNYMMEEMGYWLGTPAVTVNFNVSWNQYASLFILERFPEAHDLAEKMGADPHELLRWRNHFLTGVPHFWRQIYQNDPEENWRWFSPQRTLMRLKILEPEHVEDMQLVYQHAHHNKHPAAPIEPARMFACFMRK